MLNTMQRHFAACCAALLLASAAPIAAQQDEPAPPPPRDWVFNERGQKTDQTHYTDLAADDALYPINVNQNWGLMNQDGDIVVYPRFDWTDYSYQSYARYVDNGKTGYLRGDPADDQDPNEFFIMAKFDYADRFINGAAVVMIDQRWGMIDRGGRALVPLAYDGVLRLQDGFAGVEKDGKCGFVNRAGDLTIPLQFKRVRSFHNGYAAVQLPDRRWGYIDKRGQVVWLDKSGRVTMLGDFHESYARVRGKLPNGEERWGYITRAFRFRIDPTYEDAKDFHNGLAAVKQNGKWGFINATGRWAVEPRYDEVDAFDDMERSGDYEKGDRRRDDRRDKNDRTTASLYAMVKEDGRWGYIYRTGRPALVPQFEDARPFFRGLARVERDDSFAYITERGQVRFDPRVVNRLGMVNVSSKENSRVAVAQNTVNVGDVQIGGLTTTSPTDEGIANKVIGPPRPREPVEVPYVADHLYTEMLPAAE